jgi:hypothetical protein
VPVQHLDPFAAAALEQLHLVARPHLRDNARPGIRLVLQRDESLVALGDVAIERRARRRGEAGENEGQAGEDSEGKRILYQSRAVVCVNRSCPCGLGGMQH